MLADYDLYLREANKYIVAHQCRWFK